MPPRPIPGMESLFSRFNFQVPEKSVDASSCTGTAKAQFTGTAKIKNRSIFFTMTNMLNLLFYLRGSLPFVSSGTFSEQFKDDLPGKMVFSHLGLCYDFFWEES